MKRYKFIFIALILFVVCEGKAQLTQPIDSTGYVDFGIVEYPLVTPSGNTILGVRGGLREWTTYEKEYVQLNDDRYIEGCFADTGWRTFMYLNVTEVNLGDADFWAGQIPDNAPQNGTPINLRHGWTAYWDVTHGHWHLSRFMDYYLTTCDNTEIVRSRKQGYCVGDALNWYAASDPLYRPRNSFNCWNIGQTQGYLDNYNLQACNGLDITGLDGNFFLILEIDPDHHELQGINTHPDIVKIPISIHGDTVKENDSFSCLPIAPDNFNAIRTNREIKLNWTNNSTGEYQVERAEKRFNQQSYSQFELIAKLSTGTNTFSDTAIKASNIYLYRIRVKNDFGVSAWTMISIGKK